MKRTFIFAITVIATTMLAIACLQEEAPSDVSDLISGEGERTEITVSFSDPTLSLVKVRNSILEGAETVQSGATVYACLVSGDTAVIDDIVTVDGASVQGPGNSETVQSAKLSLRRGRIYNIYVVGNAWYINKSTGEKANWADAMGADMPADFESGLQTAVHRFDGSDFRSGYRHETMAEVRTYGIPYSGRITGVNVVKDGTISIDNCRFLFAKVNLTVDHTGLDGNLDENYFKNTSVSVKQANGVVSVFSDSNRLTASSAAIDADGDPSMTNAHRETYTFYVPENMQGNLLDTDNPTLKSLDNPLLSSSRDFLTYLEFKGTVNPSNAYAAQIGYTGDFTYRFCLGKDNCRNFDVAGGRCYNITLNFIVNSLFNPEAEWKVSSDSFMDSRVIDVTKDAAFANPLGSTFVAVRKNRGNTVYLYVNKQGGMGGANAILGKELVGAPASYNAADLTDCAVHISPSQATLLADCGISMSYDKTTGAIGFSVGNAAKFDAFRAGEGQVDVTATLLPSKEGTKTRTFTVKALEDMEVVLPSGDLYIGQKTTVTAKGFCGTPKLSSSVGTVFRTINAAGDGGYLGSTPVAFTNGKIDLYAYNYNGGNAFDLTLVSDDDFNDGATTKPFRVKKPRLKLGKSEVDLGIDGTEKDLGIEYYPETGSTPFASSAFDPAVYEQVMAPVFILREENKRRYFGFSGTQVFFVSIPEQVNSRTLFGNVDVSGKNSALFPKPTLGSESTKVYYRYPSWISGFADINSNMFNEQMPANSPLLSTSAVIDAAECSPENFRGPSGSEACGYTVVSGNDFSTHVNIEDVGDSTSPNLLFGDADSQGHRTLTWSWKPSAQMCVIGGIDAPWGERSFFSMIFNKHRNSGSGGTISVALASMTKTFDISYRTLDFVRLATYHLNTNESYCYVCSRLSADVATKVFEDNGRTGTFPTPPMFMQMCPVMQGRQFTVRDWKSQEGGEIVNCGGSNKLLNDIRVLRCILDGNSTATPEDREYQDIVWDESLIEDQRKRDVALPGSIGFGQTTQLGGPTTMPSSYYPGENDIEKQTFQKHLPISCMSETLIQYVYE